MGPFEPVHIRIVEGTIEAIKRGWCQTHLATDADLNPVDVRHGDKFCLLGATFLATWNESEEQIKNPRYDQAVYLLLRALCAKRLAAFMGDRIAGSTIKVIEIWNDKGGRRQEDVLDLLAEALVIVKGNQRTNMPAEIASILSNAKAVEVLEPA
jgi:hypothetical protein